MIDDFDAVDAPPTLKVADALSAAKRPITRMAFETLPGVAEAFRIMSHHVKGVVLTIAAERSYRVPYPLNRPRLPNENEHDAGTIYQTLANDENAKAKIREELGPKVHLLPPTRVFCSNRFPENVRFVEDHPLENHPLLKDASLFRLGRLRIPPARMALKDSDFREWDVDVNLWLPNIYGAPPSRSVTDPIHRLLTLASSAMDIAVPGVRSSHRDFHSRLIDEMAIRSTLATHIWYAGHNKAGDYIEDMSFDDGVAPPDEGWRHFPPNSPCPWYTHLITYSVHDFFLAAAETIELFADEVKRRDAFVADEKQFYFPVGYLVDVPAKPGRDGAEAADTPPPTADTPGATKKKSVRTMPRSKRTKNLIAAVNTYREKMNKGEAQWRDLSSLIRDEVACFGDSVVAAEERALRRYRHLLIPDRVAAPE